MKKIISITLLSSLILCMFAFAGVALAEQSAVGTTPPNQNAIGSLPTIQNAVGQTSGTTGGGQNIANPLKSSSIQCFISDALKFVVNLLAIAGVVYIMWTGMMFVAAQGKPEALQKAQKSFLNAIIGMAIILGAWAIATAIANTVSKITQDKIDMPSQNSC